MNVLRIYVMKIFKIINNNINDNVTKMSSDWDDITSIPDAAETLTSDEYEKNNPLCADFWVNRIHIWQLTDKYISPNDVINRYKENF